MLRNPTLVMLTAMWRSGPKALQKSPPEGNEAESGDASYSPCIAWCLLGLLCGVGAGLGIGEEVKLCDIFWFSLNHSLVQWARWGRFGVGHGDLVSFFDLNGSITSPK